MQSGDEHPAGSMHSSGCSAEQPSGSVPSALIEVHNMPTVIIAIKLIKNFLIFPPFNVNYYIVKNILL